MKKIYWVIYGKYRKSRNFKISFIIERTLDLCVICSKYKNEDEKIFKEESIEILRILCLIKNIQLILKYV